LTHTLNRVEHQWCLRRGRIQTRIQLDHQCNAVLRSELALTKVLTLVPLAAVGPSVLNARVGNKVPLAKAPSRGKEATALPLNPKVPLNNINTVKA